MVNYCTNLLIKGFEKDIDKIYSKVCPKLKRLRFESFRQYCQKKLELQFIGFWRKYYQKDELERLHTIQLVPGELDQFATLTGLPEDDISTFYYKFASKEKIQYELSKPRPFIARPRRRPARIENNSRAGHQSLQPAAPITVINLYILPLYTKHCQALQPAGVTPPVLTAPGRSVINWCSTAPGGPPHHQAPPLPHYHHQHHTSY